MFVSGRIITQAVNVLNASGVMHRLSQRFSPVSAMNHLRARPTCVDRCMCSKYDDGKRDGKDGQDAETAEKVISPHLKDKFLLFEDKDSEVILDIHEEFKRLQDGVADDLQNFVKNTIHPPEEQVVEHNLQRGRTGVYDIEDLVAVVEAENCRDICVIQVPQELMYADYLVIASARSTRHISATMEFVNKLYKKKKNKSDRFLKIQGEDSKSWMVLDMGNIVLHLMLPDERSKYDIETLWAVGEKYDDNCVKPQDEMANALQAHLDFLATLKPLQEEITAP